MRRLPLCTFSIALALLCLLLPPGAAAESHEEPAMEPLLWISYVTAEPGKSNELGMHMIDNGKKLYDGLVADGHAVSWGVAQAINHYPEDDWTHLEWVNFRDWAAAGEFVKRFLAGMQAMSPEERAADAAKWAELTVHGSHYDRIGKHHYLAVNPGRPGYIALSSFNTKPGKGADEVKAMYEKWRAPVMKGLMDGGQIQAHGFYTQQMHGPSGWQDVTAWFTMADLGGMDAVDKATEAADDARSEEQQKEWLADMQQTFEMPAEGNHTDVILAVLHYHSAAAGE